jgi:hypothetical protein
MEIAAWPQEAPGGIGLMVTKYLLESLHPPVLALASYLTADWFEAVAGHRGLFVLPYSYMGMLGRLPSGGWDDLGAQWGVCLATLSLSLVISALLAWRVGRDAGTVGFTRRGRQWWVLAIVLGGLPAYATYRLTRPTIALVTCANCGRMRRPDKEVCHQCGATWHVPELTPPLWRVVDGGQIIESDAAADIPAQKDTETQL